MRRWSVPAVTGMLMLATACGSTVAGTSTASSGGTTTLGTQGGNGGLAVPSASAAGGATGPAGAVSAPPTSAGVVGPPAAAGGAAPVVTSTAGTRSRVATSQVAPGPGVTKDTVYIGISYCSSCGAADSTIGATGAAASYDQRNVDNAIINYANAHGGFAGRKLQPIYFDYNPQSDTSTQDQAACAAWTQDHKVFAIAPATQTDDILRACAEKAGAVAIGTGSSEIGSTFQKYPHYVDITGLALDKLATVTVNGLARAGYFTGKFGLVTWDNPNFHYAVDHGYLPVLAAHHVKVWQTAYINVPQQVSAIADTSAAVSSAVTKFRAMGIDHVIVQDGPAGVFGGAGLTLEWMNQAKSQNYYPRYGQNAANAPGWSVLPSDQMDKALAVDQSDGAPSRDAGWHTNQARELCYKIEADAGYPVSPTNVNDQAAAGSACDTVFLLQRMFNRAGGINPNAFMAGVNGLGTSFGSAEVYGTKLTSALHGGGGMVRTEEYFKSCQCLRYQGAPYYAD